MLRDNFCRRCLLFSTLLLLPGRLEPQAPCGQPVRDSVAGAGLIVLLAYSDTAIRPAVPQIHRILPPVLTYYTALFGGSPRGARGKPYSRICLELTSGARGGGEADPEIVRMVIGDEPMFGLYSWEMVLLHELFHLWSAESFRYSSGAEQWFNEGVAELYMLKTAAKVGLIPADQVPAFAAMLLGFYNSANDLGRLSLRQAGDSGRKASHY